MVEPVGSGVADDVAFPAELLSTHPAAPINPLMAGTDWAATPLGPVHEWTTALRTVVSVCLSSPFPMLIMWGC